MKARFDRRSVLAAAGGLALFAGLGRTGRVLAAPKLEGYPFALGVASGDPWPDGFVIWTRLAPRPLEEHGGMPMVGVPVRWEVAEDERFARIVRSGEELARPELGHSVHVEVQGLQPARPYWYRFHVEGSEASPAGTARTAPAAGSLPGRVRLVVAGCQQYYQGWFDAWRHISREPDLDAVFHYGDYIYESASTRGQSKYVIRDAQGNVVERVHVGGELFSLDDYRRRYAQYKTDADLQAAHLAVAFITSFDDHETVNDFSGERDANDTPLEVFALRRQAAMQAWYENSPVRRAQLPRAGGLTMYRRLDYGRLLRMHVLDTRSYRANQLCAPAPKSCPPGAGVDSSILGSAQEAWLDAGLASDARWNLIAQQVFVMPLKGRNPEGQDLPPFRDKWSGYPGARQRLVRSITDRKLTNVVIATGDAHMNAIGTVPVRDEEPGGPAAATEFLATSIASNGDGGLVTPAVKRFLDADNPFLAMCNDLRGYHTHEITAKEWRTDVMAMDQVQRKGGTLGKLASFHVTPDKPGLHKG